MKIVQLLNNLLIWEIYRRKTLMIFGAMIYKTYSREYTPSLEEMIIEEEFMIYI